MLRKTRVGLRAVLALGLAAQVACLPRITERCRLVTNPTPPPALPAGLAEVDALLLRRATDMTLASRDLNSSLVFVFHRDFAEQLLPAFCERLGQARELAMAGRTVAAGKKYQALLVSSQVLAFAVAIQAMAQYADRRLQAGGQVSRTQEKFASEATPILRAALSEDPREIERALGANPAVFAGWAALLEEWPLQVDDAAHQAKVAMVVLDIAFLVVATYRAAGAAAEIAVAGRPPTPPLPAFAVAGGATAASYTGPAALEMAEALRTLIALGVLDAGVVAALSMTLGGGNASSSPILPNTAQMSVEPKGGGAAKGPVASGPATRARPAGGMDALKGAGQAPDRGGLTRAGRALAKHGGREGSVFPRPTGSPADINQQGQAVLEDILGNVSRTRGNTYGGIDYFGGLRGGGARFDAQNNFIGFLEP